MEAVQQNGPEAPPEAQSFMVGIWGVQRVMDGGTLTVLACRECTAKIRGEPVPEPKRWPATPNGTVISMPGSLIGAPPPNLCGMCRLVMREDDNVQMMRIYPDDLGVSGGDAQIIRELLDVGNKTQARVFCAELDVPLPGAYPCCSECVEKYRPAIHRRLSAQGLIPATMGVSDIQGDWLM